MPGRTPDPQPETADAARRKLVDNERLKITAALVNNAAAAALVAGVIAPVAAGLYGASLPRSPYWWLVGFGSIVVAAGLHAGARRIFGRNGTMTGLEIYALASPFILLAFGWGLVWWAHYSVVRSRREAAASPTRPAE